MIRIRTVKSCDSDHSVDISADQIVDLFLGRLTPLEFLHHNISLQIFVIFANLILQTCLSLTARLKMFILLATRSADLIGGLTRVLLTPYLLWAHYHTSLPPPSLHCSTPLESICIHKLGLFQPRVPK